MSRLCLPAATPRPRGIVALCLALLAVTLPACGGGSDGGPTPPAVTPPPPPPPPPAPAVAVTLTPATVRLEVGQTARLTAQAVTATGAAVAGYSYGWSSATPAVLTVDTAGVVTGLAPGTATITVTATGPAGAFTSTAAVTVDRARAVRLQIEQTAPSVVVGDALPLTARAFAANGAPVTVAPSWSSASPAIATVDAAGVVRGVSVGDAVVRAQLDGLDASVTVTVRPVPVARVTVRLSAARLAVGQTATAEAVAVDAGDRVLSGRTVVWRSDAPTRAAVSTTGIVTAVAPGTADIRATVDGVSGAATVEVLRPIERVEIGPDSVTLNPGGTRALTATARDAAGSAIPGLTISWRSSAPGVALVNDAGVVQAIAPGRAEISAEAEGRTGRAVVWVVPMGSTLQFRQAPTSLLLPGRPLQATVIITQGAGTQPIPFDGPITARVVEGDASALFGTRTVLARQGVASFDDIAFRSEGEYRLQFDAPGAVGARSELLRVGTNAFDRIVAGSTTGRGMIETGEFIFRTSTPITLRTASGALVTRPVTITATVVRGRGILRSGSTVEIRNGSGTLDLSMASFPEAFDVQLSAPGFAPTIVTISTGGFSPISVFPGRTSPDTLIDRGGTATFALILFSDEPVHSLVLDIGWPTGDLALVSDTVRVNGATVSINRSQLARGTMRLVIASTTPLPMTVAGLFDVTLRGLTTGRHTLSVTLADARNALGQTIGTTRLAEEFIRVR